MKNAAELYKSHEALIKSRAEAYSRGYGTDYSDALSEASEVFCSVVKKYDPDLGKFSTLLYNSLKSLTYEIRKQQKRDEVSDLYDVTENDTDYGVSVGIEENSFELYESAEKCLSEDGKIVLEHIFLGTFNYLDDKRAEVSKFRIKTYLKEVWSWESSRIKEVMKELESWYKEEVAV